MDNQQEIEIFKLSKLELEKLYLEQKLSDFEIGKKFGVSLGRIHRLRNKYNIKTLEQYQRHHKQELTSKECEFLVGTILGDAHVRWRKGKNTYPQIMFEQSVKKLDYIKWLKDQMKDWQFDNSKHLKQSRKIKNHKVYHSYCFQTICHPVFIEFHNGFYIKNKKYINIDFIEKYFSVLSLAVWLMDDGTKSKNRNIALCTHSFNKKENKILSNFLSKKYKLHNNLWRSYEDKCYIGFTKESSLKLTSLVKKYVIPFMKYKLISSETTKGTDENLNV